MAGRHGAGCSQRRSAWFEAGRCISLRLAAPRCAPTRRAAARCDTARQDANRCGPLRHGAARHDAKCAGRTPLHVYSLRLTLALLFDFAYSTFSQADMAQLVEHNLAKVGVAGSSPVVRSIVCARADVNRPFAYKAAWPSGKAEACKAFTPGSNPGFASSTTYRAPRGAPVSICLQTTKLT